MRVGWLIGICLLTVVLIFGGFAYANKSSVVIEAPATVKKGAEITIKVTASHNANTRLHYTEWLRVMVNQKEVARWDFTGSNLPEGATFTREIKLKTNETLEVTAEASCNNHGSKGPATVKITVSD